MLQLSHVHTVAENGDCRRIQQSPFSATVAVFGDKLSPKSATIVASVDRLNRLSPVHTVTENGDCRRKRRLSRKTTTVAENDDCRRIRQPPFSATVAVFGDKL